MKTPIDEVKGVIVGYDERRGELLIRAKYDDYFTLTKRGYKTCQVQLNDSRQISDKQRKACYSLIRAIADETGEDRGLMKEYMKIKFLADDLGETADRIFSLSNAPMSLVCAFQRFLVRMILEYDIPCSFPLLDFVDDIQDYIYSCLVNKKCCICGKKADLHHTDHVGMGRDRTEIAHEGMKVQPLCREHHTEAHTIGQKTFNEKWHLSDGIEVDKTIARLYRLKTKEKNNA